MRRSAGALWPRRFQTRLSVKRLNICRVKTAKEQRAIVATVESNIREFAEHWVERMKFRQSYENKGSGQYINSLASNAGVALAETDRPALIDKLQTGRLNRAEALLEIVNNREFAQKEDARSLVLLHYFGYLRRNPDDPPDGNLDGFNYWLKGLEASGDRARLTAAFMASGEYKAIKVM